MEHLLSAPVHWWACPSCDTVDRSEGQVVSKLHPCPALGGLSLPLQEVNGPDEKPDARHQAVEREDYIGADMASPIMSIRTDRGDGSNDITVLVPTATIEGRM